MPEFNIFIKLPSGKTESGIINTETIVHSLKKHLWITRGMNPADFELIFAGQILDPLTPFRNTEVMPDSTLHAVTLVRRLSA